ncbi:MAG: ISL3 family transposase [Solobacterium sp.]|nr:ISL3 family transposase [Solobacterium sp.]
MRCPYCGNTLVSNGFYKKKLTHSTLVNRSCMIIFHRRRYICRNCECTFSEPDPFASKGETITHETKINVLKDLKESSFTYSLAAKKNNISVTKVIQLFDKHVSIPRKQLPEVLSIDEHYFPASDFDSLYICILMNFKDGTIIDVLPDRKKDYLISYFGNIRNDTLDEKSGRSELSNVRYVSIDLYEPYRDIARTYFRRAVICADSFHVLEHLVKAFRDVRLRCRRNTQDENIQYLLTKFKFIFDHGHELDNTAQYNKRFRRYMNYRDMTEILFERFPDLKKAYDLKESYITFNATCSKKDAPEKLAEQIAAFADSGIPEYIEFYNLLINWNTEIINSFSIVDLRRINNSYIESRNRQIEKLFLNANGFTNFKRTRNRILYCLNKKDSYKF